MKSPLSVAVLGQGEAGSAIARDLVEKGASVRGWDPAPRRDLGPIPLAGSGAAAVAGADVVLSVNAASVALEVAQAAARLLGPGRIFADLNTGGPRLKVEIARIIEATGALFADVALMAPVPGRGLRTPALVSGSGAADFRALFRPLGMPLEFIDAQAGSAAGRKLLRSVFMKGWAAAVIESLEAARAAGCEEWLHEEIAAELERADRALLVRLVEGSHKHAVRRIEEMEAVADLLRDLGVEPRVSLAAMGWLEHLASRRQAKGA